MILCSSARSEPLQDVLARILARADAVDAAGELPLDDIADMAEAGLLRAVVPQPGQRQLPCRQDWLNDILQAVGSASLTVGRLYEGHVNASRLVAGYGGPAARDILAREAGAGRLLGVWNAERADGPRVTAAAGGWRLTGRKIHCSGAGHIRRAVVTACDPDDRVLMLLPDLTQAGVTIDVSVWRATGMRGTATATVEFDDVAVPAEAVVGSAGDYYRSPLFSGGAWRVLAVQLGGLQRILALHAARLQASGRAADPMMRMRFAEAAADCECARLLVAEAARRAEDREGDPAAIDAYVDQARAQFERFALAGISAARRNVGLSSFIAPEPLDRCIRDLETYLRQPFLDASRDNAAAWLLGGGRFDR
jgi:alkylation response protein AidB-like acyl-CoA dehydrogenase